MRFTEDTQENVSQDFIPRRYFTPLVQVLPYYFLALALVIGSFYLQDLLGTTTATIAAFCLITVVFGFVFYRMQETNDLAMANDFQNLLFAGAASLGSSFCFFARRDGTVVYANEGTRRMFPNFAQEQSNALDALLHEGNVSKESANKLYSALTRGKKENLVIGFRQANGTQQDFILIIDPLQRPSGYSVVHGRPFHKERNATVKLPGILGNTSLDKIETLLDSIPIGIYLTNETGLIEYANPALERMIRYEPRCLIKENMPIQQLVYHADGHETGEFGLLDYTGNVLLSCRNRTLTKSFLEQRRIVSSNGQNNGFLGIVTPVS